MSVDTTDNAQVVENRLKIRGSRFDTDPGHRPREKPILFSAPMVRAILAGRKTQTRRSVRFLYGPPYDVIGTADDGAPWPMWFNPNQGPDYHAYRCPYGAPGTRLWVRETWCYSDGHVAPKGTVCYRANLPDHEATGYRWRPSIHMPRTASRITLEVTEVRAQRLQDITEEDAKAEGSCIRHEGLYCGKGPLECFQRAWETINGKRSWTANPWVWVVAFRPLPASEPTS